MQVMDFSALGAQAVAQVERAQRAAREQLMAAMNQRPKLSLKLELEGPKIAIPVPATDTQGTKTTAAHAPAQAWLSLHWQGLSRCLEASHLIMLLAVDHGTSGAMGKATHLAKGRLTSHTVIVLESLHHVHWMMAAGKLTLVVDLGTILLQSDMDLISKLPQEEAALYECLRLSSRDISAYVVDGEFSFNSLEAAGASALAEVRLRMQIPSISQAVAPSPKAENWEKPTHNIRAMALL